MRWGMGLRYLRVRPGSVDGRISSVFINKRTAHEVMASTVTRCAACSAASLVCCHSRQLAGDRGHSESASLLPHEYKQLMLLVFKQALGGSSYTRLSTAAPLTSPYWPCLRWAGC